jgi:hypothetical protein
MKLKTTELQDAVTRVYKGVGNNKLIPLTSLINIIGSEGTLLLTSTDSVNFFTTKIDNVDCNDFEISVNADVFTKLVQKMTSETISLEVLDSYLMVVGNGKYKIDLFIDETGEPVKFPNKDSGDIVREGVIKTSTIRSIIANSKASLAVSNEVPCLMNYYCGENVVTTDRYKICSIEMQLFESPKLLSPAVMELLSFFSADEIKYYEGADSFSFDSEHEFLYAPFVPGVEKMPIQAINGLIEIGIDSMCRLPKAPLLSVLDRLSLFVHPYDKNGIYLTFSNNGLAITSKHSNGSEVIEFVTSYNLTDFTCCIDIEMLRSQVNTINSDNVDLYFGSDIAIKFVDEGITKIVALMEDDRVG